MSDQLQALMQSGPLTTQQFAPNSRYYGIETATLTTADGRVHIYLRRRFCPPPERFALLQEHTVAQGERLDNLTAQYYGDPEVFWRVCDANNAIRPDDLTETLGTTIRITLPEGIPSNSSQ